MAKGAKKRDVNTVKTSRKRQIAIDPDSKIEEIKKIEDDAYKCSCCGKKYNKQYGNFLSSASILYKGNGGYTTICKNCLEQYYKQLINVYSGNEEHAIERCCQIFDWYYSDDVVLMTKKTATDKRSRIMMYPSKMGLGQIKARGTTYIDTVRDRSVLGTSNEENIEGIVEEVAEENEGVSKDDVLFFGFGYTTEEYLYLIKQYESWSTRYEAKTKAQEELFKNLCIVQLMAQRAQQRGNSKEFTEVMKTFQDLLGSSNLKPSQTNDNALVEQNTFGTLIKRWENEKPIGEPEEEWKDADGIKNYIETFFLGHLCKLVHVENDCERQYEEEMAKYTVTPPAYNNEEASDTNILDKYSSKGNGSNGDG